MSTQNNLRKVFGKARSINQATRSAEAVAAARKSKLLILILMNSFFLIDNELTTKWLNRLRNTANNNASREQHAQLSSILDFYNRESHGTQNLASIDWNSYENTIHTKNVVGAIRQKYDNFMNAEFNVDGAISQIGGRSEAMKALDVAMHYNYNLWMVHYLTHLEQIETLHNIGDVTQMSRLEMTEMFPEAEQYNAAQQEIGNLSP